MQTGEAACVRNSQGDVVWDGRTIYGTIKQLKEKALRIAIEAHKGQVDKAGEPYIFHVIRVASGVSSDEEKIVALLHDVIEDSAVTRRVLEKNGFPQDILDAVQNLTKLRRQRNDTYLRRVATSPLSVAVKISDLRDNMDLARIQRSLAKKDLERMERYRASLAYLRNLQDHALRKHR